MLFTKDQNSINKTTDIKVNLILSKTSNIFDDANNYYSSSLSSGNTFKASDRSNYNSQKNSTYEVKNKTYNYVNNSNESNKSVTQAMPPATSRTNAVAGAVQPDLIIQNAVNPSVGSVGGSIQVSYQVKNQGTGSAGYQQTKFFLSKNTTLSDEDTYLGYEYISGIAAGAYSSESTTLSISNSIATGNYYLLYQADGDGDIVESNETNNVFAKAITINKADLIIQNAVNPSVGSVGGSIQVSYQVKNQG
ncbi:CARDB domain-containing protein, partial [Nostoc sp. PA-18-2419]|uniref:CARDB domain-containing protein n=1 Tax=Nostoc sp. PA-18-2419 TaxID=2575443 RepID=UPI00294FF35F